MRVRTDKIRCERCKQWIPFGASAVKIYGRIWHTDCAVAYKRQRQAARGELVRS